MANKHINSQQQKSEKILFVDFNYFFGISKEIIVKEFVCFGLDGKFSLHEILLPPYSHTIVDQKNQNVNEWCVKNLGNVPWNCGLKSYHTTIHDITRRIKNYNPDLIYVKGIEKQNFLRNLLLARDENQQKQWESWVSSCNDNYTIMKIEEMQSLYPNIPSFREMRRQFPGVSHLNGNCYFHSDGCALLNMKLLLFWYLTNLL